MAGPDTYFNPETIRPKYDDQMAPGIAGMYEVRDRKRYENAAGLQDLMLQLEAKKQQEEYTMGMPVRAAERASKLATLPLEGPKKQADLEQVTTQTGNFAAQRPGLVADSAGKQVTVQMQRAAAAAAQVAALSANGGPDVPQRIKQWATENNIQPGTPEASALREILATKDPKQIHNRAIGFGKMLAEQAPAYQQEMAKGKLHNEGLLDVENARGRHQLVTAQARTASKNKDSLQLMREAKTVQESIMRASAALADSESDPRTKDMAMNIIRTNWAAYERAVQKGEMPMIAGLPVRPLANSHNTGPQRSSGRIIFDNQGNPVQ